MSKIKIFLSYSKPFRNDQLDFLDELKKYLHSINIKPIFLEQIHYSYKSPLEPIVEIINDSFGTIVIAFERFHSYIGYCKEDSKESSEVINGFYTSTWVQIEAGITYSKKKPLLIIKPDYILEDGIVDNKTSDYYEIFNIECKKENNRFTMPSFDSSESLKDAINNWILSIKNL